MDKHVKGPIQLYRESVANIKIVDFNGGYTFDVLRSLYLEFEAPSSLYVIWGTREEAEEAKRHMIENAAGYI